MIKYIHCILFLLINIILCQQSSHLPPPRSQQNLIQHPKASTQQRNQNSNSKTINKQNRQAIKQAYQNQNNLRQQHRDRVRKFRNKFQFPIRYQAFLAYTASVCLVFLFIYLFFRCYKKCKKQQIIKLNNELNEKYFNYTDEKRKRNSDLILPTFCPAASHKNQFHSYQNEYKGQTIQSPNFGKAQ